MQAYQRKMDKFFVSKEKSLIGLATGGGFRTLFEGRHL